VSSHRVPAVELRDVVKRFGSLLALDHVDLAVAAGEIVALVGPNGAGKSTLVRTIVSTVLPDHGSVAVCGHDVRSNGITARSLTGLVLSDDRSFFWRLTGRQNLEFFAALHGIDRRRSRRIAHDVLGQVGLGDAADRRVEQYSVGMRARLGIARALLSGPRVLLLDEPTRSVDPVGAIAIRQLVKDLANGDGVAVLFATHDLHEAAEISDRTIVLVGGRVMTTVPAPVAAATLSSVLLEAAS
jgi:ABC-2 type transport system ATP-binding protein